MTSLPRLGLFMLALTIGLSACSDTTQPYDQSEAVNSDRRLVGKVQIDGSSTVFPISEAVAEEFNAIAPRVRITVGVSGTGGGFKKFINNEIDISNASRSIKPSEADRAAAAGIDYIELPVAFDGLSVVVNPKNDWVDHLTIAELNHIWRPEAPATRWREVRADWPDQPIKLYGPGTDSGTFDYFTKVVNGKEQASRPDFTASEDDNVLVQGIAGDLYSLGYFGYAYYKENQDKLSVVAIDGGTGAISPSETTINDGTYSPLSRPVFIYARLSALEDPITEKFVHFYLDQAEKLASEVGYIPMPQTVYQAAHDRVSNRITGSAYLAGSTLQPLTQ
jgi:phosphate transport system substrate-binding protein